MTPDIAQRSVVNSITYSESFKGMTVRRGRQLDISRLDAWVALVKSGMLTDAITAHTPQLGVVDRLGQRVMYALYDLTISALHGDQDDVLQYKLDTVIEKTQQIKALIDATPANVACL